MPTRLESRESICREVRPLKTGEIYIFQISKSSHNFVKIATNESLSKQSPKKFNATRAVHCKSDITTLHNLQHMLLVICTGRDISDYISGIDVHPLSSNCHQGGGGGTTDIQTYKIPVTTGLDEIKNTNK